jgi:hypothetical protein
MTRPTWIIGPVTRPPCSPLSMPMLASGRSIRSQCDHGLCPAARRNVLAVVLTMWDWSSGGAAAGAGAASAAIATG